MQRVQLVSRSTGSTSPGLKLHQSPTMKPLEPSKLTNMAPNKSSGTLTSLQRTWSTTSKQPTSPIQPLSSSQPSWKATESEWPPSPPSKQTRKHDPNLTLPFTNPVKYSSTASGSLSNATPKTSSSGFQPDSRIAGIIAKRAPEPRAKPASVKREFPWDVPSSGSNAKRPALAKPKLTIGSSISAALGSKNQLGNPKLSIAAKVSLSKEQQAVLDSVLQGQSVFFTGSAGTGKSVLLRHIIAALKRQHSQAPDGIVVTASTAMAACAIGGTTIHSFAGIGLALESPDHLVNKIRKNRKAASRWLRAKVLIIDEISMVDGDLFDKLAHIAQKMKRSNKPFGGIQLIMAGDFFQLPPISKGKTAFAFNAKHWAECISQPVNLSEVFRQKDTTFIDMLNEMRLGTLSEHSIRKFRELSREIKYSDGIMPTELYPTRQEVERSNSARLAALPAEPVVYTAYDSGKGSPEQRARDFANMLAVEKLVLKKGAQVMMIKNQNSEDGPSWLVNGLVGKVEDFIDSSNGNSHEADRDKESFPPTRGTKLPMTGKTAGGPKQAAARALLPYVAWCLPNGRIERTIVEPAEFTYENAEGEVQSKRTQLPLILAWAMSIHKSQGQTLSRVKVDLGKVFEKGQIYVALSRATSLEGLQVLRFDPKKVMAHPEVSAWSRKLLALA